MNVDELIEDAKTLKTRLVNMAAQLDAFAVELSTTVQRLRDEVGGVEDDGRRQAEPRRSDGFGPPTDDDPDGTEP